MIQSYRLSPISDKRNSTPVMDPKSQSFKDLSRKQVQSGGELGILQINTTRLAEIRKTIAKEARLLQKTRRMGVTTDSDSRSEYSMNASRSLSG
jgi:hypothetical protein